MEQEKNKKGVTICLISIIVVLAVLCISLEAGVFNSNKTTDNSSVNSFLTSNKLISTSDSVSSNMPDGYVFLNNGRFAYYNYSFDIGYIIGKNGKKEIDYNRMISGIGTWTINNNELILKFEKEEHAIGGEEINEPPYPYLSNYKREIKNVNKETKYTINKIDDSSDTTPFLSLNNNEVKWYSLSISEEYINIPKELAQNGYSDTYNQLIKTETDTLDNITTNNTNSNTTTEINGLKVNNNGVAENDLNTTFDILGIAKSSDEVYKDNCLNAYISDNNYKSNSKKIFVWYVISHKLETNHGNEILRDVDGDGKADVGACGGAADCGTIKKSDATKITKLYGLTNMDDQFEEMLAPYTDEYMINYYNLSGLHPITCNISTRHNITAKYDNGKDIVVIDNQNVTEYGYLGESDQVKSQKDQTVTYVLKNDNNDYYLDSVSVK